jgi:hypothetical protein
MAMLVGWSCPKASAVGHPLPTHVPPSADLQAPSEPSEAPMPLLAPDSLASLALGLAFDGARLEPAEQAARKATANIEATPRRQKLVACIGSLQ